MYGHLLVPIDDSALSVETVRQAVRFASKLGAKVTFFHANADYGATSVGALDRVVSPAIFNEQMAGDARALLAKAEAVARAANVAYASAYVTSDHPYAAILDAAETQWLRPHLHGVARPARHPQPRARHADAARAPAHDHPVLVAAVEGNAPAPDHAVPLAIIRDEHRSLAAVIYGLEFLVRETREHDAAPQFPLLRAMLHYIKSFAEALHHPKEDAYLFRKLRLRTSEFNDTLDELERQHVEGAKRVANMDAAFARYEMDPVGGFDHFAEAVKAFAALESPHMMLETKVILPAAQKHLTDEDWAEMGRRSRRTATRGSAPTPTRNTAICSRASSTCPRKCRRRHGARMSARFAQRGEAHS